MPAFEQDNEESEAEATFRRERAGGNYGGGTKELQLANFKKRQERDARRNGLFESGLEKYYAKDIQGVHAASQANYLSATNSLLEAKYCFTRLCLDYLDFFSQCTQNHGSRSCTVTAYKNQLSFLPDTFTVLTAFESMIIDVIKVDVKAEFRSRTKKSSKT